eukprot:CAMPEP_0172647052 /NCGR_PEP_ID=MMETSP1068-20121228/240555_1 /TAXON_ID=35684 /ORGANISM="Pseudopedinella elastica, Strain CCMP716" /LENGTH=65 /DNA_ID=CAMNT_0013461325 /DNA_START=313 /DNA_END=510 /DNA_ORIENTATION=+
MEGLIKLRGKLKGASKLLGMLGGGGGGQGAEAEAQDDRDRLREFQVVPCTICFFLQNMIQDGLPQ